MTVLSCRASHMKNWSRIVTSAKPNQVTVDMDRARGQGYATPQTAERAARRGLRWLRNPRNLRLRPPYHIARKLQLVKVTK